MNRLIHFFLGHRWVETGGAADDTYLGYRSRTRFYKCRCGKFKTVERIQDMVNKRTYDMVDVSNHDPVEAYIDRLTDQYYDGGL